MMRIKPIGKSRYVVNGMLIIADTYKQALAEYVSITNAGARVVFARKG